MSESEMEVHQMEVHQVVDAVRRSFSLSEFGLPGAFFPAHLSVALIDAFFHPRPRGPTSPTAGRYCRRFGLARTRAERWDLPPVDEQETLGDLIRRCDEIGPEAMANEIFGASDRSPGRKIATGENVLAAARALRSIGVDVLQDVPLRSPREIGAALRAIPRIGKTTVRKLLMYAGEEEFVQSDAHVRRFVASAIGRRQVSAERAEALVRAAAHELILSPRFLDFRIWDYGVSGAGVARPPAPPAGSESVKRRRWMSSG